MSQKLHNLFLGVVAVTFGASSVVGDEPLSILGGPCLTAVEILRSESSDMGANVVSAYIAGITDGAFTLWGNDQTEVLDEFISTCRRMPNSSAQEVGQAIGEAVIYGIIDDTAESVRDKQFDEQRYD